MTNQNWRLAQWTGTEWIAISEPRSLPTSLQLVVFDDGAGPRLYALGGFATLSGVQVGGFARWLGGTAWERPPSNNSGSMSVRDVAVFDHAIWAYGYIYVNGQELPGVARWNGQIWEGMGGPPVGQGEIWTRSRIEVFDDGGGPQLYVTGSFATWAGIPARGIARWNGQAWSSVYDGCGPGGEVNDMVAGQGPFGPTLFVGGLLNRAGGGTIRYVAQYVGCPNCYPDGDRSGSLNVADFVCFPYANCDNSTTAPAINVSDFVCFSQRFAGGCP
jgi:hypothetical protein